ncbi:MAG: amino acid ABC transporter permease [Erysipelotrichaceae bacterium]|nr:amino acid ABC transporter permease [Erysipelotrichaceae bacterium]
MRIDLNYAWRALTKSWPLFLYGIRMTLAFAIVGTVAGLLIGLVIGAIHALTIDPLDKPLTRVLKKIGHVFTGLYVWVFRGTPMMVQAVFLYYLLKPVVHWSSFTAGMFIISINTGAYMAEIIRSGIQSIDIGQTEAAKSIGMTNTQLMIHIIFPQAIKNTFPSLGNQLIVNIKDSCMLNAIAVTELYFQATSIAGSSMRYIEIYMITACIYLVLTTVATFILNNIERRLSGKKTVALKEMSA